MFATINGTKLAYQLDGSPAKPCVVLIHGFPFARATWKAQVAALKGPFCVLTYDLRGMGQSHLGAAPQPLEAYVDDLIALMDELRLQTVGLVGLSMGGYIALRAVQRNPERFWSLVLCDTKAEADSDEGRLGRAAGIKALHAKGARAFATGMLPKLLHKPGSPAGRGLMKVMLQNKVPGMANALAAMQGRTDTTVCLKAITVPALVIVGRHDLITPPQVVAAMARKIPGSKLTVLRAGHVSNLEAPAAFNKALLGFFLKLAR